MQNPKIVLIDYGMGNLLSVSRGLEHVGAEICTTSDPDLILNAERVVLPGVGAFPDAMEELNRRDLVKTIRAVAHSGKPLLGICLGMHLLFESSLEFNKTEGIGLIAGNVVPIPNVGTDACFHKIPHIGWNALLPSRNQSWSGGILAEIVPKEAAYFVHSFMAQPRDQSCRIADSYYGGISIAAVVGQGNVIGCQFHPEKSGEVGLRILRSFLSI